MNKLTPFENELLELVKKYNPKCYAFSFIKDGNFYPLYGGSSFAEMLGVTEQLKVQITSDWFVKLGSKRKEIIKEKEELK